MKEESEQAAFVCVVLECGGDVLEQRGILTPTSSAAPTPLAPAHLRRHENHQRHVEVMRNGPESQAVIRVDHQKGRAAGEGEQVAGVQAAVLLYLG